jgi:hypothetical protein
MISLLKDRVTRLRKRERNERRSMLVAAEIGPLTNEDHPIYRRGV